MCILGNQTRFKCSSKSRGNQTKFKTDSKAIQVSPIDHHLDRLLDASVPDATVLPDDTNISTESDCNMPSAFDLEKNYNN